MASYTQSTSSKDYDDSIVTAFDRLTAKQHEVLALIAEGRTTKEIAWQLQLTDSAINQRIETVRSRAGSPPRAELARAYRRYVALKGAGSVQDQAALTEPQAPGVAEDARNASHRCQFCGTPAVPAPHTDDIFR